MRSLRHFRAFQNRERLDRGFSDSKVLAPGNRVEFSDGLHTITDVVAHLPVDFAGVLDLSVCNSVFLAEVVRRHCPKCRRVVANEDPTMPRFRLINCKYAYKIITSGARDYLAVLSELRERRALAERGKR